MTSPTLTTPAAFVPLGLTRDEKHVYAWNDGVNPVRWPIPSVTGIIKLIDKSGPLVGWAKRETAASAIRNHDALTALIKEGGPDAAINWLKTIPDYQRDRAADRGTSVHQIAEQIIRGTPPADIPEELAPYINAYLGFIRTWQPKWIAVEQMVVSLKHDYAGTFDAFAVIAGERWLLDIKTSTGVYSETALQLAAYGAAEFIGRPGDPVKYRVPRAQRFGVIHVVPEGAELVPYAVDRGTFATFLRCREVWQWTQDQAKTVVGKPLDHSKEKVA